ncbi:MAG: hypothetical protein VKI82_15120 [Leptolyngbya sp.]|nr:hypothetical protein [Leptolyngbya sp.]
MVNQSQSMPPSEGVDAAVRRTFEPLGGSLGEAFQGAWDREADLALPEVIQHPPKNLRQRAIDPGQFDAAPDPQSHPWRWLLLWVLGCLASSAAVVGAFLWLVNLPPIANCDNPATITTDRAALSCVQVAAETGDLEAVIAGLTMVEGWGPDHGLAPEIPPLVEDWSAMVVAAAEQELRQGRYQEAEALLTRLPRQIRGYSVGQALLAEWNQEWEAGSALVAQAQTAIARQDWPGASAQVLALATLTHPHWREEQVRAITRQIYVEQQAQAQIRQAVALASLGGTERLVEASRRVGQMSPDTVAYQSAQTYLDRWSDLLLAVALQRWYQADLDGAIHLGQVVSHNPHRAKAAQELIWLSQARQKARESLGPWKVNAHQMAGFYAAMLTANRIPSDSPYYPQAQSSLATWRTHLDGMATLQLAQIPGDIRQVNALKLALRQAETIPPDHPRRVQAQTLMAHWQRSLEQLEDAPYLRQARQSAQTNTPEGLRQAIALAQRIDLNRALRQEAQGFIYEWTHRLQTLEDQPVLDRAYQLAAAGQFSQAVAAASTVQAGRALYDEAQRAIAQWQRTSAAQARRPDWSSDVPASALPNPSRATAAAAPPQPRAVSPANADPLTPPVPSSLDAPWSPGLPTRIETVPGDDLPLPPDPAPIPVPLRMTPPGARHPQVLAQPTPPALISPPPTLSPPIVVPPSPILTPPPTRPGPTSHLDNAPAKAQGDPADAAHPLEVIYTGSIYLGI